MYGVTKITSAQDMMMITFTDADSHLALPQALTTFAAAGVVVDMICQSTPRGTTLDFCFTTPVKYFDAVMKAITELKKAGTTPLISSGYSKIGLFGKEMVTSCGVAARALTALAQTDIEVGLITTSDLDISLLVRAENEDSALLALQTAFVVA